MSINAGDKLCTTGMSGKIYTDIVSNLPGGQLPSGFTPAATTAMKLQIYSFAKGISDEINQDGGSGGGGGSGNVSTSDTFSTIGSIVVEQGQYGQAITGSLASVSSEGSVNIPTGQTFNINNVPLNQSNIIGLTAEDSPTFADILLTTLNPSTVLVSDSLGNIISSNVSSTTLTYLDATSSIQNQLNNLESQIVADDFWAQNANILSPLTLGVNISFGTGGLLDQYVSSPIPLGDSLDTSLLTGTSIVGAINSLYNNKQNNLLFTGPLTDYANVVALNYNNTNLKITSNNLNTIQDIYTGASPTFSDEFLSSLTGSNIITNTDVVTTFQNIDNIYTILQDPTGFDNPQNVIITYSSLNQTVVLSGSTWQGYYRGKKVSALSSSTGYTSPAHANTTGHIYWFSYNPTNGFHWTTDSFPGYGDLLISLVDYQAGYQIGLRECHGMMAWMDHQECHQTIGTYNAGGGTLSNYVTASTTPANRRPFVASTQVKDEDIITTNPALTTNSYTIFNVTGAGATPVFTLGATDIVPLSGNRPFWNQFTGGAWTQTAMTNNSYMSVWLLAIPASADAGSQAYDYIWVQGQSNNTSLANEQALTSSSLNTDNFLSSELAEFIYIARVIINYTPPGGGNWNIEEVDTLVGTRLSQLGLTGNFLSSVSTDTTMTGNGQASNPLSIGQSVTNTSSPTFAALVLNSPLPISSGGTGANNASTAINNLLPTQISNMSNWYLKTNGSAASWAPISISSLAALNVTVNYSFVGNVLGYQDNNAQQAFYDIDLYCSNGMINLSPTNITVPTNYMYEPMSPVMIGSGDSIMGNSGSIIFAQRHPELIPQNAVTWDSVNNKVLINYDCAINTIYVLPNLSGSTVNINFALSDSFSTTLNANTTLTFSNPRIGHIELLVGYSGGVTYTITFPSVYYIGINGLSSYVWTSSTTGLYTKFDISYNGYNYFILESYFGA